MAQWSRGFLLGHEWLEELWEDLPEGLVEELDAILMALGFFSSREMAEGFHDEATTGERSFEAMADAIHRLLPRAVRPVRAHWPIDRHGGSGARYQCVRAEAQR